jgi:hypothetical protein
MYVTTYLWSGLGNRLFQVAAAAWYARQHGRTFVIYKEHMRASVHDPKDNEYLLEMLGMQALDNAPKVKEVAGTYEALLKPCDAPVVILRGYFQDARFAEALRPLLNRYFAGVPFQDRATFMHVRFADSSSLGNFGNIFHTNIDAFYQKALESTNDDIEVYSNGTEDQVLERLRPLTTRQFRLMPRMTPRHTLECMMNSRGAIISNSTFSWWGAQFMHWKNPTAKIVLPKPWARLQVFAHLASIVQPTTQPLKLEHSEWSSVEYSSVRVTMNEYMALLLVLVIWLHLLVPLGPVGPVSHKSIPKGDHGQSIVV